MREETSVMRPVSALVLILFASLTLSTTHPMLAGEPRTPEELVQLFLHGVAGGTAC